MILAILLAALSWGQSSTSVNALTLEEQIKLQNAAVSVRELQSGRPTITGRPTYRSGFCFSDGTCQTTAPAGGGAGLTSTQTFSGANTFTSTVTIGPNIYNTTAAYQNIGIGVWTVIGSSRSYGATAIPFTNLISSASYRLGFKFYSTSDTDVKVRFNDDANNNYTYGGRVDNSVGAAAVTENTGTNSCYLTYPSTTRLESNRELTGEATFNIESTDFTRAFMDINTSYLNDSAQREKLILACSYDGSSAVTSITVRVTNGGITGFVWLEAMYLIR